MRRRATIRLTAAALAATLLVAGPADARKTLATFMTQNGYVAVPLTQLKTGHEAVAVTLNGVACTFVLDSGAGVTVLHQAALAKFGLSAADKTGSVAGYGAGGQLGVGTYPVRSFQLAGNNVPLPVIHAADLSSVVTALKVAAGADVDGVIGQDVLTTYGGVIDVANNRLYLRLPK